MPILVGGTSYYIESIIYVNSLVSGTSGPGSTVRSGAGQLESGDADVELSACSFRGYTAFRHANDPPTADTVGGVGRMYADGLAEAVRFARTMPAVARLPPARYRNTFVADDVDDGDQEQWPISVAECETAALYAHGVRVLDTVAVPSSVADDDVRRYRVLATDVTTGLRRRYARADVLSRLDALLAETDGWDERRTVALKEAFRRTCAELEYRTQRLALALLIEREQTAVELMSPQVLKAHAAYYDQAAAIQLHPHNTRKIFRYVYV